MFSKLGYQSMDTTMCAMMNFIQWKLRHHATTKDCLETYLEDCSTLNRSSYFACSPMEELTEENCNTHDILSWKSPLNSLFPENNRAKALFFPTKNNSRSAPTLIVLHALMSASDRGYRRLAAHMNHQGWNLLFPHLPFHYSRTPKGYRNGSLAITADLVRNGETLRQAVQEIRQLITWSRNQASERVALLGTSYGGWISALTLSLEPVDCSILLQPIVNISHASFDSPIAQVMGKLLRAKGITLEHLSRHAHLTSPLHCLPQCVPERLVIIGGRYDQVSPPCHLQQCCTKWNATYDEVAQGHFGYKAMQRALYHMERLNEKIGDRR